MSRNHWVHFHGTSFKRMSVHLFLQTVTRQNPSNLISDIDENLASDFDGSLSGESRFTIYEFLYARKGLHSLSQAGPKMLLGQGQNFYPFRGCFFKQASRTDEILGFTGAYVVHA